MATHALQALAVVTLALVVVLVVRRPLRRICGAAPAFGLWLLPPVALVIPWLPMPPTAAFLPTMHAIPAGFMAAPSAMAGADQPVWWLLAWLAGTAVCLIRLGTHYRRLRASAHPLPAAWAPELRDELAGIAPERLRLHATGPAVLWAPRSLVLLPADFIHRFDPLQRRLVLRHELAHLHHGDALWALLAEVAWAALWFHPLAWLARQYFRLDMELACDERVLGAMPYVEHAYARTLLHSVGLAPTPTLIPWLTGAQLKERLTMIQHHRPGRWRRRIGFAAVTALLVGGAFVAHAATQDRPAASDLSYNVAIQPHYPAAAIKAAEQGTVILDVQVLPDGAVGTVDYDAKASTTASADLIAAATDAARQWRFNPEIKDGKPVTGHARVPVAFSMTPLPGKATRDSIKNQGAK